MKIAPPDIFERRASALRAALASRGVDALIVTSLPNVAYLTGFFASAAALVVAPNSLALIGDSRYSHALRACARNCPFIQASELPPGSSYDEAMIEALTPLRGLHIAFEAAHMTVSRHRFLVDGLEQRHWTTPLIESVGVVEELRARKDAWEIERLREGAGRLSSVAKYILPRILAGRTEADVAVDIESRLRSARFERPAFDTIVASGPNAALPHARAGQRRLEEGDLVVVDFGGVLDGYCTDLTRSVVVGRSSERQRHAIEAVIEAQDAAFGAIRAGAAPEAVDAAAREALTRRGMGEAFTHGTGHGLGLEVHETPRVTCIRPNRQEPLLAAGMVMTLEPGVYFPGWGGVRIEDDVLVTNDGAEWLTDVPRIQ